MLRSISTCVLALSLSAIGCAAPSEDERSDESASTSDAIKYCPPGEICDPVIPKPPPPPPPRADLRAEIINQGSYCLGTVQFRVRNFGTATAPASVVSVAATGNTTLNFAVPSLPVGGSSTVFTRAYTVHPGDVGLTITADVTRVVTESSESNNVLYGVCIT